MPYGVYLPGRWRRQPQGPVAASSLARDLGFELLVNPTQPFDSASQVVLERSSSPPTVIVPQFGGPALGLDGSGTVFSRAGAPASTGYNATLFAFVRPAADYDGRIVGIGDATNGGVLLVQVKTATAAAQGGGSNRYWSMTKGAVKNIFLTGLGQYAIGTPYFFASSYRHSTGAINSVLLNLQTGAVLTDSRTDTTNLVAGDGRYFVGGSSFAPTFGFNGSLGLCGISLQVLSNAQLLEIGRDPWQLFRPLRPILYSFPSAATAPTLSAATVIDIGTTSARPRVTVTF